MINDPLLPVSSILIVDDEPINVQVLHEAIRDLGNIYFASNGQDALDVARQCKPDVILLDIEMPGMNGYAVCEAIKADPLICNASIIFVTIHNSDQHELQALNLGGVDFISKPLNVPIARARVKTHLELQLKTRQLIQARLDLSEVIENLPAFIAHLDSNLINYFCNDVQGLWFGVPAKNMIGQHLSKTIGNENYATIEPYIKSVLERKNTSFDMTFARSNQTNLFAQVSLVHRYHEDVGNSFLMLITDITARKLAEIALSNEMERLRVTLNSIGDAVISTDKNGIVDFINPIAETYTGWTAHEAIGQPIENIMSLREGTLDYVLQNPIRIALQEQRIVGMAMNCVLRRRDGKDFAVEDSAAPIRDITGNIIGAIIVFHDVSSARAMAIKMTHLANHDALTNLPNRMLLQDRVEQALQKSQITKDMLAMIIIDIDHFKFVNETLGHTTGDQVLKQMAQRLKQFASAGDTVSRQGGNEFILLLTGVNNIEQLDQRAKELLAIISKPYDINGVNVAIAASAGLSVYPSDSANMEELHRHADAAMYSAKQEGRNCYRFFSNDIEEKIRVRHLMEINFRSALENNAFEVFYQPKIDARNQQIIGVEALVRWRHADGQLIFPSDFIPWAEESGLIIPLGYLVLRKACMDAKQWHRDGYPIRVAINISPAQFNEQNFVTNVQKILVETQIDIHQVDLEITEGTLASDFEKVRTIIFQLKNLGLRIAIDDFGTGYSSLSYLKQFPIDVLKIDQSFIRDMLVDNTDKAIIMAIIQMAHGLNLRLIAEGVETQEQADTLLNLGCHVMQGYLYSRPIPYEQLTTLLYQRTFNQ